MPRIAGSIPYYFGWIEALDRPKHWGPHFTRAFWGPHFPDLGDVGLASIAPFDPGGVEILGYGFENGMTLTLQWLTDIIKTSSGREQRIANLAAPKQFYSGQVVLEAADARGVRTMFAKYGATGASYVLGISYESMTLTADATGTQVHVSSTAFCDWKEGGQRVIVRDTEGNTAEAVVQSVIGGTITLDRAVGSVGREGGEIMPARTVFFDPQQGFIRYPTDVEVWQLTARATNFTWAPTRGSLNLSTVCDSPALANATISARIGGIMPITFSIWPFSFSGGVSVDETGGNVVVSLMGGASTVGEVEDLLNTATYVKLTGTFNRADILDVDSYFAATPLVGGALAEVGAGATLTSYASHYVWDYPVQIDQAAGDSVSMLTNIIDLDGRPTIIGSADYVDWGRQIKIAAKRGLAWQWLKKFLWAVRGRQKSFWLPTWRNDLAYVSHSGDEITVTSAINVRDWWPRQRRHLQIIQANGTMTYAEITAVTGSVITLSAPLGSSPITKLSWLELCRFERDQIDVKFKGHNFSMQTDARVVQQ